jgi:hypothetical protein
VNHCRANSPASPGLSALTSKLSETSFRALRVCGDCLGSVASSDGFAAVSGEGLAGPFVIYHGRGLHYSRVHSDVSNGNECAVCDDC